MPKSPELDSPGKKWKLAAAFTAAGRSITDISLELHIKPATITKWRKHPKFISTVDAVHSLALDVATAKLMMAMTTAVDTLLDLMKPEQVPSIRLGAANSALQYGFKRVTDKQVIAKLERLEALAGETITDRTCGYQGIHYESEPRTTKAERQQAALPGRGTT